MVVKPAGAGGADETFYKPVVNSTPLGLDVVKLNAKVCRMIIEDADRIV